MKKILLIADTHIPDRATSIPEPVLRFIEDNKPYDIVVHAGDLVGEEVLEWVKSLAPQVYVVVGNMDYLNLPLYQVFSVEGLEIGVYHGHRIYPRGDPEKLYSIASRLKVKVLFTAHTHYPDARVHRGVLILNPGSLTGSWGGAGGSMKPSLALVQVSSGSLEYTLYELSAGRLRAISRGSFKPS